MSINPQNMKAMKRILPLTLALLMGFSLYAQRPKEFRRPDITQLVSNLSDSQKSKLDNITTESRQRIDKLRSQQKAVRDSIAVYMDREGDQSKYLYPLFDREAALQVEISREMYATKVRINEVLNKEQREEFLKASKLQRKKPGKKQ